MAVKAFPVVDNFCVVKGKMVLYLTVHFQFRAGDFFVFLWYPPITVDAVYQHPNIMRTIHLLTVGLQNTTESLQVSISRICVLTLRWNKHEKEANAPKVASRSCLFQCDHERLSLMLKFPHLTKHLPRCRIKWKHSKNYMNSLILLKKKKLKVS